MDATEAEKLFRRCDEAAELLAGLAHPNRLKILCAILESEGRAGVSDLAKACKMEQPVISQFLARMSREGLLRSEREGRTVRYQIKDERVLLLMTTLRHIFCPEKSRPISRRRTTS